MSSPPIRRPWDRAATFALFLASGFALGIWAGNVARLKEAQGLSDSSLGLLLLAISGGAVAAMPLTGRLAARVGAARLAAAAGVIAPALLCLPALVTGWPALIVSCIALGMALGIMDVAMNGHASAVEQACRAPMMSSFHGGWSLGGLGGSVAAGGLAAAGVDLAWSFALPAGVVLLLSLPGFGLRAAGPVAAGGKFALPGRAMVRIAAVAALCYVAEGAVADWSGVYLRTELGTDAARAASAYGFFALAMAAGRVGGDAVVRRAGARAVVRYGGGLAAVGFALLLAVPDPTVADASLAMIGLGLSNVVPLAFSAAGRLAGTSGIAMASTSGYAGFMASPPVIGAVADVLGLRLALLLVLAGVIAIASLSRVVSPAA